MIRNYFKIAYRSLFTNGIYSLINLTGLITGIACSTLIFFYVIHEYNYDRFHSDSESIFQVNGEYNHGGREFAVFGLSSGFGPMLMDVDPRVQNFARIQKKDKMEVSGNGKSFFEENNIYADGSFLEIFNYPLISGNAEDLNQPGRIFLTENSALKYFGTPDVLGEELTVNRDQVLTIGGVLVNPPSNSSITFDQIISAETLGTTDAYRELWNEQQFRIGSFITYIKLDDPKSVSQVEESMAKLNQDEFTSYSLAPIHSLHLNSGANAETNIFNLYIFLGIGVLVLLLAIINYVNLTIARATARAKEIGVRKVNGANRNSLVLQFYIESAVFIVLAFTIGLGLAYVIKPAVVEYLGIQLDTSFYLNPYFIGFMVTLLLVMIFIAGSYPSLVLSRFSSVNVMKGKLTTKGEKASWLQKGFTSIQFAVSVVMIFCTITIGQQLRLLKNQQLGLEKDQVMVLRLPKNSGDGVLFLKNEITKLNGVNQVGYSSTPLYAGGYSVYFTSIPGNTEGERENVSINHMSVDANFIDLMGLTWHIKPTDPIRPGDLLINEAAMEKLRMDEKNLGTELRLGSQGGPITGVVGNYKYEPLSNEVGAMVMRINADTATSVLDNGVNMYIKMREGSNLENNIAGIESKLAAYRSDTPMEFYFLSEAFDNLFRSQQRLSYLFLVFSSIAVIVACLGLFGLVTYTLERRIKEIGIRKIMGASPVQIVSLFVKEYVWLFLVSALLAIPVAWFGVEKWLTQFPEQIELSLIVAMVSVVSLVFLGFLVVALRSWLASTANVVNSLRSE